MKRVAFSLLFVTAVSLAEEPPKATNPIPVPMPRPEERGGLFVVPKDPATMPVPIEEPKDPIQAKLKEVELRKADVLNFALFLFIDSEIKAKRDPFKAERDLPANQKVLTNFWRRVNVNSQDPRANRDDVAFRLGLLEKRGELNAILKNLLDLPPHLFIRDLKLQFEVDPNDETRRLMQIFDRESFDKGSKKSLGYIRLDKDLMAVDHKRDDDEIKKLADAEKDPNANFKGTANYDPNVHKLLALAPLLYNDNYAGDNEMAIKVLEGEIEQLIKDLFAVKYQDKTRPLVTEFTPRARHVYRIGQKEWRHNSTMMTIYDKETYNKQVANREVKTPIGVIGFHYAAPTAADAGKQMPVRIINYRTGATATIADLFTEIRQMLEAAVPKKD